MEKNPFHFEDLFISFAEKYPWAFDKLGMDHQINDHMLYLGKKTGSALCRYILPGVYKPDYLLQYKDNHICTFSIEVQAGSASTLSVWCQPDNYQLIQANLGLADADDTEFSLGLTLHTSKPQKYIDMLNDVRAYRILPPKKNLGFNN